MTLSQTPKLKHRRVAKAIVDEIAAGSWKPGERLPAELELAQRFDVSYMTMRQAVRNLVEQGVIVRIKGKGTFVAQPASVETRIGLPMTLLIPGVLQRIDPYYLPEVLEGFQEYMDERGRHASLRSYRDAETSGLEKGSAVACLLFERPSLESIETLRDSGYKVLAINRYSGRRLVPCVRIDDAAGVEMAVGHLASLGHERIGFIMGPRTNLDANERLRGFRVGVARYEIKRPSEAGEGFTEAAGYSAAKKLLSVANRPTALVCASDLSAMGAVKAAHDCGLSVPRGLSIVGFGDFSVAEYTTPRLTTVRQHRFDLGRAAAASLIRLADGEMPEDVVVPAEIVFRESAIEVPNTIPSPI